MKELVTCHVNWHSSCTVVLCSSHPAPQDYSANHHIFADLKQIVDQSLLGTLESVTRVILLGSMPPSQQEARVGAKSFWGIHRNDIGIYSDRKVSQECKPFRRSGSMCSHEDDENNFATDKMPVSEDEGADQLVEKVKFSLSSSGRTTG